MFNRQRFDRVRPGIEKIVGPENVFCSEADLMVYSYDSGMDRARPEAVVRFTKCSQVGPVAACLYENKIPYIARGSGTNLSGGCIPLKGGVILELSSLNKILEIDTAGNFAVVEPGVLNMTLQNELAGVGYFYAPDPASQRVCSIGGNVGENAGGPSCLKYGVTSNHVIGMELITPEGKPARWFISDPGPDLVGLMVGSEGTLGIATKIWLKIIPKTKSIETALCAFDGVEPAINAVTEIIEAGILPRALEAMDKITVSAVESHIKAGYPDDCEAVLIIEVDGNPRTVKREIKTVEDICRKNSCLHWKLALSGQEREKLWEGRRGAYAAMARLAPNVLVEDGVVPRPRLPEALKRVREIAAEYKIHMGLLFHAGDGNLHPNIIFDERNRDETRRVKKAGYEMLKACVELGGSVSGEHGIGVGKRMTMSWLHDSAAIELFRGVKSAFDPGMIANPDKIIPVIQDESVRPALLKPRAKEMSPRAHETVQEVRRRCQNGMPSAIIGMGTKVPHIPRLKPPASRLTLNDLCTIVDLDRANYTVTVEAGIDILSLKKELSRKRCHLHVPDMKGSLGGLLASKAWLAVRDIVLGMEILLPDGNVVCFGGKTMKNVAGYDLVKLMLGSWGAYGIILTATLRLYARPLPPKEKEDDPLFLQKSGTVPKVPFSPNEYHRRLKKVFDPHNLFNPWIFEKGSGLALQHRSRA